MICFKCQAPYYGQGECPTCRSLDMPMTDYLNSAEGKVSKELADASNKRMDKMFNDSMKNQYAASTSSLESQPFTAEKLEEMMNFTKRTLTHIYIMECNHLPDDCYGILMVRPEDAKKWNKNKTEVDKCASS